MGTVHRGTGDLSPLQLISAQELARLRAAEAELQALCQATVGKVYNAGCHVEMMIMNTIVDSRPKLHSLTSLRFAAAAMIVIGHAHGLFGSLGIANQFSLAQGVSFFFVLSGFILAYNYPQVERDLIGFYQARFARIWPLHIVGILLLPIIAGTWNTGGLNSLGVVYTLIGNVFLIQSWVPFRDSYLTFNGVAWSISTEAAFYLAFPIATYLIRKSWLAALALTASLTIFFMWVVVHFAIPMDTGVPTLNAMGVIYVNPLARLFEFVLGMVACQAFLAMRQRTAPGAGSWTILEVGLVAMAVASMHFTPRLPLASVLPASWVPVTQYYMVSCGSSLVFALLIAVFGLGRGLASKALQHRALVFLGEASFALYLIHTTVLLYFEQHSGIPRSAVGAAAFWATCLLLAAGLHLVVERPARSFIMKRFREKAPASIGLPQPR